MTELNIIAPLCSGRVLDLNANTINVIATQTIKLKVGIYRINFIYYLPYENADLKELEVRFN
jgi:hypothetical protein